MKSQLSYLFLCVECHHPTSGYCRVCKRPLCFRHRGDYYYDHDELSAASLEGRGGSYHDYAYVPGDGICTRCKNAGHN